MGRPCAGVALFQFCVFDVVVGLAFFTVQMSALACLLWYKQVGGGWVVATDIVQLLWPLATPRVLPAVQGIASSALSLECQALYA
jgi:hypothetical protein